MQVFFGRIALVVAAVVFFMMALAGGSAMANHVECGEVITSDTTLDSDVVGCPEAGVTIGAPGVKLDLNGHAITGYNASNFQQRATGSGVDNGAGHDGVEIVNGTITNFTFGTFLAEASDNKVRGDHASGNTFATYLSNSDGNRIEGNSFSGNLGGVVLVGSSSNSIRGNSISGNQTTGINLGGSHNRVAENSLSGNGILVTGPENELDGNVVSGVVSGLLVAIQVSSNGNSVHDNSLSEGFIGLVLGGSGNRIESNVIADNALDGIQGLGGTVNQYVAGNSLSGNYVGIRLRVSESHLLRNSITGSRRSGAVVAGSDNLIERNAATDNGLGLGSESGDGFVVWGSGRIDRNEALRNGDGGIHVLAVEGESGRLVLERNRASDNVGDGIDVDSVPTTIAHNDADDNGDFGIEAVSGVEDGGSNRASDNGNPLQCLNVFCK